MDGQTAKSRKPTSHGDLFVDLLRLLRNDGVLLLTGAFQLHPRLLQLLLQGRDGGLQQLDPVDQLSLGEATVAQITSPPVPCFA